MAAVCSRRRLGGHADVLVETVSPSRPYIESGKLVPIALTGPKRSAFAGADLARVEGRCPNQRLDGNGGTKRYTDGHHSAQRSLPGAAEPDLTKKLDDMSADGQSTRPRISAKSGKRRQCGKPRSRRPASRWSNARSDINGPGNAQT
jgi:hypothetical protein